MAKLTGESSIELDAPIEAVYAICADILKAPEWQGGYKRMKALETDSEGRATLVEVVADAKVKELTSQQRFSYEPPTAVRFEQAKGDLKHLSGAWTLQDLGGGRTKATFAMEADPGRMLGALLRGPVEATLRSMLVGARADELAARVATQP